MVYASSRTLAGSQAYPYSYAQKAIGLLPHRWQEVAMKVHRFLENNYFPLALMFVIYPGYVVGLSGLTLSLTQSLVVTCGHAALLILGYYLGQDKNNPLYPITENIRETLAKWSFVDNVWMATALGVAALVTRLPIFIVPVLPFMFIESINMPKRIAEYGQRNTIYFLKLFAEKRKRHSNHNVEPLKSLIDELSLLKVTEKKVFFKKIYQFFQAHPSDYPPANLFHTLQGIYLSPWYQDTDIMYLEGKEKHAIPKGCATTLCVNIRELIEDLRLEDEKDCVLHLDYPKDPNKEYIKDIFISYLRAPFSGEKINKITPENVHDLLDMAHYYQFEWLEQECSKFIVEHVLNPKNVCETLRLARQRNYLTLFDKSVDYILKHADALLTMDEVRKGLEPFQNDLGPVYYALNKESMTDWKVEIEMRSDAIKLSVTSSSNPFESLTETSFQHLVSMIKYRRKDGGLPISLELKGFKLAANQLEKLFALDIINMDMLKCRLEAFSQEMGHQLAINKSLEMLWMRFFPDDTQLDTVHLKNALKLNEKLKYFGVIRQIEILNDADISLYCSSKSIKNLVINERIFHPQYKKILENPVLESLHITSQEIDLGVFSPFCQALAENQTLKELSLKGLNLNDCVIPLLEAVKQHPSLKKIKLKSTQEALNFNEDLQNRFKAETPNIQWISE